MVLAGLDGGLFLAGLRLLSLERHCSFCYFNSLVSLNLAKAATLACIFVLLCASVGIYNADALRSFRTFAKRFAFAWQLIFILSIGFFAISKIALGVPFGWFVGIFSIAISLFMLLLLALRFFFHLYYRSPRASPRSSKPAMDRRGREVLRLQTVRRYRQTAATVAGPAWDGKVSGDHFPGG